MLPGAVQEDEALGQEASLPPRRGGSRPALTPSQRRPQQRSSSLGAIVRPFRELVTARTKVQALEASLSAETAWQRESSAKLEVRTTAKKLQEREEEVTKLKEALAAELAASQEYKEEATRLKARVAELEKSQASAPTGALKPLEEEDSTDDGDQDPEDKLAEAEATPKAREEKLKELRERVDVTKVPKGIRVQDLLCFVEEHHEWLQGPSDRPGKKEGCRKNMYDVCQERIIEMTTSREKILTVTDEVLKELAEDLQSSSMFEEGSLQFKQGTMLGGEEVGGLVIQAQLCRGGQYRKEYWKLRAARSTKWKTNKDHGRCDEELDPLPESLRSEEDLGEKQIRKEALREMKLGAVLVLRTGVAFVDTVEQGPFEPLNAFISHFWGEETLDFAQSVELHARHVCRGDWWQMCYYVCTFSNIQHCVDLGASWQLSPFNRALEYVAFRWSETADSKYSAAMLFDQDCTTLRRIWCLFEIWRCHNLGLDLKVCSCEEVLSHESSSPLSIKIRDAVAAADMENAECSEHLDKIMIEGAIGKSEGGLAAVQGKVQLQVLDLLTFTAGLSKSRDPLTGGELTACDIDFHMAGKAIALTALASQCIEGMVPLLLLIGPGGSGKTVFSRELVSMTVQRYQSQCEQDAPIPVRVPLAELAKFAKEGYSMFERWARSTFKSEAAKICGGKKKLLLILDGLDESGPMRRRLLHWLKRWLRTNRERRHCVVLTSRETGFDAAVDGQGRSFQSSTRVLQQLSAQTLLVQDPLPEKALVRLLRESHESSELARVQRSEEAFLLPASCSLGDGPQLLKVAHQDPNALPPFFELGVKDLADAKDKLQEILAREPTLSTMDVAEATSKVRITLHSADGRRTRNFLPGLGFDSLKLWPASCFPVSVRLELLQQLSEPDGELALEEVNVSIESLTGGERILRPRGHASIGDKLQLGETWLLLTPSQRCARLEFRRPAGNHAISQLELCSLKEELVSRLHFEPVDAATLSSTNAAKIAAISEDALQNLPEAVRATPLMASLLGKYLQQKAKDGEQQEQPAREEVPAVCPAELAVMRFALQKLLDQACQRCGAKRHDACDDLRRFLRELCLQQLKAGRRMLSKKDFDGFVEADTSSTWRKVLFSEAQLGHLRLFEPSHASDEVQLYHLRLHELLAAEAWGAAQSSVTEKYSEVLKQSMLQGTFRYVLLEKIHTGELQNQKLSDVSAELWAELLPGCPTDSRQLIMKLNGCVIGDAGVADVAHAMERLGPLRDMHLELARNQIGDLGVGECVGSIVAHPLQRLKLDLAWNPAVGQAAAEALAESLPSLRQLQSLEMDLVATQIRTDGAMLLGQCLEGLPGLRTLKVLLDSYSLCLVQGLSCCTQLQSLEMKVHPLMLGMELRAIQRNDEAEWSGCPEDHLSFMPGMVFTIAEIRGQFFRTQEFESWAPLSAFQRVDAAKEAPGSAGPEAAATRGQDEEAVQVSNGPDFDATLQSLGHLAGLRTLRLSLDGRSLSAGAVSALAEGVSGLQLENLAMELDGGCPDVGLACLSDLKLNLRGTSLGNGGISRVAECLSGCLHLKSLDMDLAENSISAAGATGLADGLASCAKLQSLELDLEQNELGEAGGKALGETVSSLREVQSLQLNLIRNNLGAAGATGLADGLASCAKLQSLELDLEQNELGEEGGAALGGSLQRLPAALTMLRLNLRTNFLGNKGAAALAEGLQGQAAQLRTLVLDFYLNNIRDAGARALCEAVVECQSLEFLELDLRGGHCGGGELRKLLDEQLPATKKNIKLL